MRTRLATCRTYRSARDRGSALLITVLIGTVVASLVLAIVQVSLSEMSASTTALNRDEAEALAEETIDNYLSYLAANPTGWVSTVHADERTRVCHTGTSYEPGATWPASCGTSWTYVTPVAAATRRIEVLAPGPSRPYLQVSAAATVKNASAAVRVRLVHRTTGDWTVASGSDLDTAQIYRRGADASAAITGGAFYANGKIDDNANPADYTNSNGVYAAEAGILPVPPTSSNTYFAGTVTGSAHPIRNAVPTPLSTGAVTAATQATVDLACGTMTGTPANVPGVAVGNPGGTTLTLSSRVCLAAGATLTKTDGSAAAIPAAAKFYLVVPVETTVAGAPTEVLRIYTKTTTPDLAALGGSGTVAVRSGAAASPNPSEAAYWTLFGDVFPPSSGVVVALDGDLQISVCGVAVAQPFPGGAPRACTTSGEVGANLKATYKLTFIAGTSSNPKNLWVGGPFPPAWQPGLVAFGDVVFPWWAHTDIDAGTSQPLVGLRADIVGLDGVGSVPSVSGFGVWPSSVAAADAQHGLQVTGSVFAPSVRFGTDQSVYSTVRVDPGDRWDIQAPHLPGPASTWFTLARTTPAAASVCAGSCQPWLVP